MSALLKLLDGKKTTISAGVLLVSAVLSQVVVGIWQFDPEWMGKVIATLEWVGGSGALLGLSHKGVKTLQGK